MTWRPVTFWVVAMAATICCAFMNISLGPVVILLLIGVVIRNWITDQTGIRNLLFLLSTAFLGAFVFRYLVGCGLAESTSVFNTVFYVLLVGTIFRELIRTRGTSIARIVWYVSGYCSIAIVAAVLSNEPLGETRRLVFSATFTYLFFILAYLVTSRGAMETVLGSVIFVLMVCGLMDCCYGIYQYTAGIPAFELRAFEAMGLEDYILIYTDFDKIISLSGSAYGLFYDLAFFTVGAYLILPQIRRGYRWLAWLLVVSSVMLLSTFTERTAVVMTVIAAAACLAAWVSKGRVKRLVIFSVWAIVVVALVYPLAASVLESTFSDADNRLLRMQELANPTEASTMLWRYTQWLEGIDRIVPSFWFGDGYAGRFAYHMEYLNVLVTFGIFGLYCWVVFLAIFFKRLWQGVFDRVNGSLGRKLALGLVGFFCALCVAAIPNNPFTYSSGILLFALGGVFSATPARPDYADLKGGAEPL
jgi:hypothetical protein